MSADRILYQSFVDDNTRWDHLTLRDDDIVICTPSKCGTTWTQMLVALLIFDGPDFPAPLSELSPWLDMRTRPIADVVAALDAQTHRRFIKTHTPLDGLVLDDRGTYVCVGRDPRDAAVSMMHHMANTDRDRMRDLVLAADAALDAPDDDPGRAQAGMDRSELMRAWIDMPDHGSAGMESLGVLVHHFRTMWERRARPNVALFHYADLKADLVGEIVRLGEVLGIPVTPEHAAELAPHASIESMRDRAADVVPNAADGFWRDQRQFLRAGGAGEWRDYLDNEGLARYDERIAELVSPDLAAWMHHGRRGHDPSRRSPR